MFIRGLSVISVNIKLKNLNSVRKNLQVAPQEIDAGLQRGIDKTAYSVERHAKTHNVPVLTGNLRSSIQTDPKARRFTRKVRVKAPYGNRINRQAGRGRNYFTNAVKYGQSKVREYVVDELNKVFNK